MDYLIISTDDLLSDEITKIIGSSSRKVQRDLSQALIYLEVRFPEVILLDLASFGEEALTFISSLRLMHPLANILIVAINEGYNKNLKDGLFLFSNITEVERQRLSEDLLMYMTVSIDQHLKERREDLAHPYTLEQIADIWREGQSGKLLLHNQRQIKLQMG